MIVIMDFGSQFAHLISKKIRTLGEYTEIIPANSTLETIKKLSPIGIILSGGPDSVYEKNGYKFDTKIFDSGIPILGICYGYQLLAYLRGGKVKKGIQSEFGVTNLQITDNHPLVENLGPSELVLMSHTDIVIQPPDGAKFIAETESCAAAYVDDQNKIYGVQFHPEVTHTPNGKQFLVNFLKICNSSRQWSLKGFINNKINELRKISQPILMAVSGGVDSTVAALLIEKAVPDLLHCVFVDNGLLRLNETQEITEIYKKIFKNFYVVDAKEQFLKNLTEIKNPEQKRKIIGKTFIGVFETTAKSLEKKFGKFIYLGQGTIYPDRIESASTSPQASVIKTHHNVGGLPNKMNLTLIEPLMDLYKFEVRNVGKQLGIDDKIINRQPFPGPGLAVRCLGSITREKILLIQQADDILQKSLRENSKVNYTDIWQSFFVLLSDVKSVGVMGDARTYEHPGIIRIVESNDAMTATVPEIPINVFKNIANKIINNVKGINRVCLDLTSKPPGTIEWE